MSRTLNALLIVVLLLGGMSWADGSSSGSSQDISKPAEMACTSSGNILGFTCNMMQALLQLGEMVAVIALVLSGVLYIYANVFVTAEQRGRYHTLAMSLVIGALILAALVGGAGIIVTSGMKFFTPGA